MHSIVIYNGLRLQAEEWRGCQDLDWSKRGDWRIQGLHENCLDWFHGARYLVHALIEFYKNDPSLEQQWRGIILFGKNSASYKFAFAKSLLKLAEEGRTQVSLEDLAIPFSAEIVNHLKEHPKQGTSSSSKFLETCQAYIGGNIAMDKLHEETAKLGFVNVVDAFHNIHGEAIQNRFTPGLFT